MLQELRVRDLALLEAVDLCLSSGLNVVSGETGEGKSLLLRAALLLLGGRAPKGLVRRGAKRAVVEGRFLLDVQIRERLRAFCDLVEAGDQEVCLRRVVSAEGAGRASINGSSVPLRLLAQVGRELVDIHGQSEHLSLLRPREQARLLDRFGGLAEKARAYARCFRALGAARRELAELEAAREGRQDRRALLQFQLDQLLDLDPEPGEESRLFAELAVLEKGERLRVALRRLSLELAEGESSVGERLACLERELREALPKSEVFGGLLERLAALRLEAEDLGREGALHGGLALEEPGRREWLESRLANLRELARRHQTEGDHLSELLGRLRAELAALAGADENLGSLKKRLKELEGNLRTQGRALGAARGQAAAKLEGEVALGLKELRMEGALFRVVSGTPKLDEADLLAEGEGGPGPGRFLMAANPGEKLLPLQDAASGGETARIMLALRGALAGHHRVPLLIFDEIDAGIGGRVGLVFGQRIARIARHHQVLVVTHLPQVAAFGETHLKVLKETRGGRTRTSVQVLKPAQRIQELAAMLGGEVAPEAARSQARALLHEARA